MTRTEPAIALVHSPRGWAQALHFHVMDHGGAVMRAYVMSAADAGTETYDVLLVDDTTSFLDARLVAGLHRRGVRVLGVFDPTEAEGAGKRRLVELGVDDVVAADATPREFVTSINRLSPAPYLGAGSSPPPAPELPDRRGDIIAVAGAGGGVGATEVAVALACALRRTGGAVLLVDGDEQAPAVAHRLGLPLHPNLRTAMDALIHLAGSPEDAVQVVAGAGIEVLAGLAHAREWQEVQPGDIIAVAREMAVRRPWTVVNVGPRADDGPGFGAPARFGITRGLLRMADRVVLVGDASPVGAGRILTWAADAALVERTVPVHVVFNRFVAGRFVRGELIDALRRDVAPRSIDFLDYDRKVVAAAWDGQTVTGGPFTRAVSRLAARIAPARAAS